MWPKQQKIRLEILIQQICSAFSIILNAVSRGSWQRRDLLLAAYSYQSTNLRLMTKYLYSADELRNPPV
jgi:hypothetical protein